MVTFITGPMYSFKTSELFKHIERAIFAKKKIILIRPKKDNREYFSHSQSVELSYNNLDIETIYINSYDELRDDNKVNILMKEKYDVVFIDEAFMIPDIHLIAKNLFDCFEDIYYAGLLASSENKVFEENIKLLPYCDTVIKLNGVCMNCGSQYGNYSYYIKGKKETDIVVGDKDYLCLCHKCLDVK